MTERYQLLLRRLLENPEQFESCGEGNALLKEHFNGAPVGLLAPLLRHNNVSVRGTAMFVANELGAHASELIDEVIPLINDSDAHIQWDALESVMVCSTGVHADKFVHVVRELENCNSSICRLAMRLVSNASVSQIETGIRLAKTLDSNQAVHERGMQAIRDWMQINNGEVIEMLNAENDLTKKYGAIVAKRRIDQSPELIQHAANNENNLVSRFAKEAFEQAAG
jgi:hypothetical protein